ncbi:MAG: hypothetical protein M1820_008468 [Bogoriella megaspora]|nr:MAG: hypothetical protein M1820_008468 [Bogoriella megaspora]
MDAISLVFLYLILASAYANPGWSDVRSWGDGQGLRGNWKAVWDLKNFKALVVFGDSYSDDSRFNYFLDHNGTAPPPGWVEPINNVTADGGFVWPNYVRWYSGARVYNYAIAGATCSNDITPRYFPPIHASYPDLEHYEVPAWIADSQYVEPNGTRFFNAPQDETVYSVWIGTNDLDVGEMLTDSQVSGTNITTYIDCLFAQLQRIYDNGARYFVLQNVIPLFLTPLVATPENGGLGPNIFWPNKPSNITAISYKMLQMVVTTNMIYEYRTPFEILVARKFPGARFALMDMYSLILDIWNNPAEYLNGTARANNTGYINHCTGPLLNATCAQEPSPDSFLWFDPSHPSEQTNRIIARTFVEVVKGTSKYATYWSS